MPRAKPTAPPPPSPGGVDLRGLDSAAALEALFAALADGRITLREACAATALVETIVSVKEVAEFKRRLLAAESANRATLEATRALAPARRQTVEVFSPAPPAGDAQPTAPWGGAS